MCSVKVLAFYSRLGVDQNAKPVARRTHLNAVWRDFHPIRRAARSTRVQRYLVFIGQLSLRFRIVVASLNCICKSQRGNR